LAQYRVKTLNATLAVEEQVLEAADDAEVQRVVLASGARLISATAQRQGLRRDRGARAFRLPIFNQQLSSLLDAGQPVVDALEILGHNDVRGAHRRIYDTLLQGLRNGKQLSEAMLALPSVFPALYVAMIRSSETTGTVRTSVRRYMQYQKQVDEIRSKLVSAAVYPAVLLSVGFLVVLFLMLYVVPRFSAVFDDVSSSKQVSSGFVQVWGGFVRHHTVLAWSGTAALLAGLAATVLHPGLRTLAFRRLLAVPWIGERVHVLQFGRLYRTLSMLLRSGLTVMQALRMAADALPMHLQKAMTQVSEQVAQGHPISSATARAGLGTEVAHRLLLAGESSGNLDEMMEKIADFYDQETATWIDTAGRLIEPALMIGIGLIIGAVVLMLYMPIFDLTNVV
jgi:general secretion pathway protein F